MQLHLVTKEIWNVAMTLYPYLPVWVIDKLVLLMCAVVFGDTSRHGLRRPAIGPFTMKLTTPGYPVVDVGTYAKIRSGEIRVLPAAVKSVRGNVVEFGDGSRHPFDAIVFATGYRSTVRRWLKVRRRAPHALTNYRIIFTRWSISICTAKKAS
jgi:indole-3-pyruvate monooxygenase